MNTLEYRECRALFVTARAKRNTAAGGVPGGEPHAVGAHSLVLTD